ncbi:hypothetical protein EVAR_6721_1 [Eumeta japonica]|uniref:Uncharacterized protein n=1 Tax=Eumeta variegata TaxID=151549 RepID=A0A4C1V3H9_EUMVA|nr:hypothetical protein EVAR_6721_1 [Eumeta japonica]
MCSHAPTTTTSRYYFVPAQQTSRLDYVPSHAPRHGALAAAGGGRRARAPPNATDATAELPARETDSHSHVVVIAGDAFDRASISHTANEHLMRH